MATYNYDVETPLETAFAGLLSDAGVTALPSFSTADASTPFASVEFTLGVEEPSPTPRAGLEGLNNVWNGDFIVTVTTNRDTNAASHSIFRAKVRQAAAETDRTAWEAKLGTAVRLLALFHESSTPSVFDKERGIDQSTITYTAKIALLPVS